MKGKIYIQVETYSCDRYFKPKEVHEYINIETRKMPCTKKKGKKVKVYKNFYVVMVNGQLCYIPEDRAVIIEDDDQVNLTPVEESYTDRYYPHINDYEAWYEEIFGRRLNDRNKVTTHNVPSKNDQVSS